jgi:signal transduction histidine kinase
MGLDPRLPALVFGLVGLGCAGLAWQGRRALALSALSFAPAALAHLGLVFPRPLVAARLLPAGLWMPYALCAVLALVAARSAGGDEQVRVAVRALTSLLIAMAVLGASARVARAARTSGDPGRARRARFNLAALVSAGAALAVGTVVGGPPPLVSVAAALALPISVFLAVSEPSRRPVEERGGRSEGQEQTLSFEQVARGIAHGMLKPLAASVQQLDACAEKAADAASRRELENVKQVLMRLQRLVRDLLDLARAREVPGARRIELDRVLDHAVAELSPRFPSARIERQSSGVDLMGDEVALRCLVVNLLENALESSGERGPVAIRTETLGPFVVLIVEDEGGGLPDSVKQRLFEPFVTTKPHGTGLGLAIVQEISRAHGGAVELEERPRGARFRVCLPRQLP